MVFEPDNKYVLINHNVLLASEAEVPDNEKGIYEVIRVIDGIPLFFKDHYARFCKSAEIAGITLGFEEDGLFRLLRELVERCATKEGNILISKDKNLVAQFIRHNYPTDEMYNKGVVCRLLYAERKNPNAKILHTEARQKANRLLAESGCYEVLLVDHNGFVTEGSRSNVFFVSGDKIFTAPGSQVLLGITRQKAIETARSLQTEVIEKEIHTSEIQQFDAAFITGTSPKILPIKQIEEIQLDSRNALVARLMITFNERIADYVLENLKRKI